MGSTSPRPARPGASHQQPERADATHCARFAMASDASSLLPAGSTRAAHQAPHVPCIESPRLAPRASIHRTRHTWPPDNDSAGRAAHSLFEAPVIGHTAQPATSLSRRRKWPAAGRARQRRALARTGALAVLVSTLADSGDCGIARQRNHHARCLLGSWPEGWQTMGYWLPRVVPKLLIQRVERLPHGALRKCKRIAEGIASRPCFL